MAIKIGINGLGRIGRMVIRSLFENNNKKIEIKHINSRIGMIKTWKIHEFFCQNSHHQLS